MEKFDLVFLAYIFFYCFILNIYGIVGFDILDFYFI